MSVLVAWPARIEPLEGLEEAVDLSWRDEWSGVGHRQDGPAVLDPGPDLDTAAGHVVADGVGDQVGDEPFDEQRVAIERRRGATRRHVAEQFLAEAVLLSVLGGLAGTIIGAVATVIYAVSQHWSVQIPAVALYGGLGAALAIGAIAGLYPSMRAARLSPTEALRTV